MTTLTINLQAIEATSSGRRVLDSMRAAFSLNGLTSQTIDVESGESITLGDTSFLYVNSNSAFKLSFVSDYDEPKLDCEKVYLRYGPHREVSVTNASKAKARLTIIKA